MSIKKLKEYLNNNNLAVEQWEMTIISLIRKQKEIFEISSEEVYGNVESRRIFEKKISKKIKAFGDSVDELSKYVEKIKDVENMSIEELERHSNQMIESFEKSKNFWDDEDKKEFDIIYSKFIELEKKIIVTNRISNFFLKYEITKLFIQVVIFATSFFLSYYIGRELEPYFQEYNDISIQFFIALILFLSLEKLLDKLEEYLVYWRVNRLFSYFRMIMPLTERLNKKQQ